MKKMWNDKGYRKIFIVEIVFFVLLLVMNVRPPFEYEMNISNLEITDSEAYIDEKEKRLCISTEALEEENTNLYSRWIASSPVIYVPFGVYELEAFYESDLYPMDNAVGSCVDRTAAIELVSHELYSTIAYEALGTYDGAISAKDRVVIKSIVGIGDFQIKVRYFGAGEFSLEKVILRELPIWRITALVGIVLLYTLINGLYYYFNVKKNPCRIEMAGLLGIIFFTSMPLFANFLFRGHDIDFHMSRILDLANELEAGRWIAPISDTLNHYGYVTPIFYGQLFLYIPAILYNLALPLQTCYQIYVVLINLTTCIISYCCFKALVRDNKIALVGAFIYTASPYRMCNLYLRAAVGEYTAMTFLPLVVYGFIKIYSADEKKIKMADWLAIVLGLTGIIQSHLLSCEMAAIFIIIVCIVFIKKTFQKKRFVVLAGAAILTLLLNIGFLLPLLDSMQMKLKVNTGNPNFIQETGVYLVQLLSPFMTFSGGNILNGMSDEMPLTMGLSLVVGIILIILCDSKKREWKSELELLRIGGACATIALIAMAFSLREFPWDSIESISDKIANILGMVQFSWRYISVATVMASFATVIGLKVYKANALAQEKVKTIEGIIIGATFICVSLFFVGFCDSASKDTMYGNVGVGYRGIVGAGEEYLPEGTIAEELNRRTIQCDKAVISIKDYDCEEGVTTFWCKNSSDESAYVDIPILNYENYYAFAVNTGDMFTIENGENNCIRLIVSGEYEGYIQIEYRIPVLWKFAYMISCITAIGIAVCISNNVYRKYKSNLR